MTKTKQTFICPYCYETLNLDNSDKVVLSVSMTHEEQGIILLNAKLGEYDIESDKDTSIILKGKTGKFQFSCPVCFKNLISRYEKFAKIEMLELNEKYCILFSRTYGEHCTFKISKSGNIERFGPDSNKYDDKFFKKEKRAWQICY